MRNTAPETVHVAIGVVADDQGRILVSRRARDAHQGGLWEFPGGKIEPGEGVERALARELFEELGIWVASSSPLIRIPFEYPDRRVRLEVRRVAWSGTPQAREGQPLAWVEPARLDPADFPAANRPILRALQLPERYLITGDWEAQPARFLRRLKTALESGVDLVQLRLDPAGQAQRSMLADARELAHEKGARILLNGSPTLAAELGFDGVHLNGRRLAHLKERPLGAEFWVGASCHDRDDLQRARDLGLDFAVLSPVLPTRSHPGSPILGWSGFAELVNEAGLPVYALGGLNGDDIGHARQAGGQGIAGIRAFWPS